MAENDGKEVFVRFFLNLEKSKISFNWSSIDHLNQ